VRPREFVMLTLAIETVERNKIRGRAWHEEQHVRTSCLVFEIDRSTIVRSASYVAHAATRADAPPPPNARVLRSEILLSGQAVYVECDGRARRTRRMRRLGCYVYAVGMRMRDGDTIGEELQDRDARMRPLCSA
jgi:hypothetical protein